MASESMVAKIKTDLRVSSSVLDEDLGDWIDACLLDLEVCGVEASDTDSLILGAVKLYVRAQYTDDVNKGAAYMQRYDAMKACLMMATGYGGGSDVQD